MSVFLTKNAPGLRTSPVKRGYWVVKQRAGRAHPAAAGGGARAAARRGASWTCRCASCWRATARTQPAPAATRASTPSGWCSRATARSASGARRTWPAGRSTRAPPSRAAARAAGWTGCATTCARSRQDDFVDNLSRKLLAYALGRSLRFRRAHRRRRCEPSWPRNGYRFDTPGREHRVEPAVPDKRGRETARGHPMTETIGREPGGPSPGAASCAGRGHHGAALAGVAARLRAADDDRSPSASPCCSWATASTATTGGPRARAPEMKLGKTLAAAGAAQEEDQRHQRPLQPAGRRAWASTPARPATSSPACPSSKGRSSRPGISMDQVLASHARPGDRAAQHGAGLRAADDRLPRDQLLDGLQLAHLLAAARTRRSPTRSTRRWPSTACSRTAGSLRNQSILDRVQDRARHLRREVSATDGASSTST